MSSQQSRDSLGRFGHAARQTAPGALVDPVDVDRSSLIEEIRAAEAEEKRLFMEQRHARLAADANRDRYVVMASDDPDFHRTQLVADEAARREREAEDSYDAARKRLDELNAALAAHRAENGALAQGRLA